MKTRLILLTAVLAATLFAPCAQAQTKWSADKVHSTIGFTVVYLGISDVSGSFKNYEGTIASTGADFANGSVNFSVDASSIYTDNEMRDNHLKSPDFFNAAAFPKISFQSTAFKKLSADKYVLEGNLTMHGVTKKVTFDVAHGGTVVDYYKNNRAGFKINATLNRNDYGVSGGSGVVSENVQLSLNLNFIQDK
jgi:hypothetical protein